MALWREVLLAKNVLARLTKGYKNHPQLDRFYAHENAPAAINAYLAEVYAQACARGYKFDAAKVGEFDERNLTKISVSRGQIEYKFALYKKAKIADVKACKRNLSVKKIEVASIFKEVEGETEPQEEIKILRF